MPRARDRTPSSVRALAARVPTPVYLLVGAWLVVAITAAFGGLATVESNPVRRAELGEVVAGRQLDVTVDAAWLADRVGSVTEPETGKRFLAVEVTVTNVSSTPVDSLDDNVLVAGVVADDGNAAADRILIPDESSTPTFQPGVRQSAVLLWQIERDSVSPGDEIRISILDKTFTRGVLLADSWTNPRETATVAVKVEDGEPDAGEAS